MRPPFRRKALTGTPDVVAALAERRLRVWPGLGGTNDATRRIRAAFATAQSANYAWMYANSPAVRTVVDLIARNMGQLDLRLYEEVDEANREFRPDHAAARSLQSPSPEMARDQFVRAVMKEFLVYDNAYALKWRDRRSQTLTFKVVPADRVEILGEGLWDPDGYQITARDGQKYVVEDPNDMIHWRGWNSGDPRLGLSPLETLRNVIAEDVALQTTIVELMASGLAGPAWVYRPGEAPPWSNDARERFEEDLTNRLRKSNRTPPVLEEGMELRNTGVSPRDAEMGAARKYVMQQIASLYGVPLGMVGLEENVKDAQAEFYADTLPPYCEAFTRQLDLSVLRTEYGETEFCFEFNLDEKHMGDDRLAALVSATGRPIMLTNEGRAKINLPPVPGGDELVTPGNVAVGGKPSPMIMPIQDPNKPSQDGDYRVEPAKAVKQLEVSTVPRLQGDMSRQHRYTDEVAGMLERFYGRQAKALGDNRRPAKSFELDRWNSELSDDLHRMVRSIVEREGGLYVARLMGDDFDMRQVEHYLKAMADGTAEGINDATRRDIEELGAKDALARARGERAAVAAASIGTRATVFARTEAAKQAPNPERRVKTWVANTDRHAGLNGATVSLESDWGGIEPGSEPGCKCSAVIS